MRDSRSWWAYIAGIGLLILGVALLVTISALALGKSRPRDGIITFPVYTYQGKTSVYGLDVGTGFVAPLLYRRYGADCAIWSPDGAKVAIRVYTEGRPRIHLVSVDGDPLNAPLFPAETIAWSPDSRQVAMQATQPDGQLDVLLLDLASGDMRNLTESISTGTFQPVWSPDGRRIAFHSPDSIYNHVYVVEVQSGAVRHMAQLDAAATDLLGWSADGRQLLLNVNRETGSAFYALDAETGSLRRLTRREINVTLVKPSPDGNLLAFIGFGQAGLTTLYVVDVAMASVNPIFQSDATTTLGDFAWSPSGDRLAFVVYSYVNYITIDETLYLVNPDGSERRELTNAASDATNLTWSPDGREIAFRSDDVADPDGEVPGLALNELYAIDVESGNLRRLSYAIGPTMPWCYGWGR